MWVEQVGSQAAHGKPTLLGSRDWLERPMAHGAPLTALEWAGVGRGMEVGADFTLGGPVPATETIGVSLSDRLMSAMLAFLAVGSVELGGFKSGGVYGRRACWVDLWCCKSKFHRRVDR